MAKLEDLLRGLRVEDLPEQYADLAPLVTSLDAAITTLGNAVLGNLTLGDNLSVEKLEVQLTHGVAQTVALKKLRRVGSVLGFSAGTDSSGNAHAFLYPPEVKPSSTPGMASVTAYFRDPTATRVSCSVWIEGTGQSSSKAAVGGNPYAEYTTTTFSTPNSSVTVVNYDTKVTDTDNAVTTGAGWKFTCPTGKAGQYEVSANISFNTSPGAQMTILLYKNGSRTHDLQNLVLSVGATWGAGAGCGGATTVNLAAGDTIDVRAFQTSGGAVAVSANAFQNRITIKRLG